MHLSVEWCPGWGPGTQTDVNLGKNQENLLWFLAAVKLGIIRLEQVSRTEGLDAIGPPIQTLQTGTDMFLGVRKFSFLLLLKSAFSCMSASAFFDVAARVSSHTVESCR